MSVSSRDILLIKFKEMLIKILTFDYVVIRRIIKKELAIKNKGKVLDIGCGTGILSPFFPKSNYTGIDVDEKLISFAKKTYKKKFLLMSVDKLKFPKSIFDKIVLVGVIHHLDDNKAKKAFEEIKRVLKKNGKLLVIEAIPSISKYNLIGRFLRQLDIGEFVRTLEEYEKLFQNKFKITKKYQQRSGIFDYGIFLLSK